MNREELLKLELDVLIEAILSTYSVGKSNFIEPEKKYFCHNYYTSYSELVDLNENDCHYDEDFFTEGKSFCYYGSTLKEAIVNCIVGGGFNVLIKK